VAGFWGRDEKGASATVQCRVVRNGDVGKDGKIDAENLPIRWMTQREIEKAGVRRDDSILVSSGAYTGNVGRVKPVNDGLPYVVSNFVRRIRADSHSPDWLFQLLRSQIVQDQVPAHVGGSALPNLAASFYAGCRIPHIPKPQQQKIIAIVLVTVDRAIGQTEALAAKYQRIKTGLMQDLLTHGIDEHGHLRAATTHKFKPSPFGSIPAEWDIKTIADSADIHNSLRKPVSALIRETMQGRFPYYGATGIIDYIDEYRIEGKYVLIGEDGDHFLKFLQQEMTILVEGKFNVNNHAHLLTGKKGCSTEWIYHFFCHRDITLHLTRQGAGRLKLNKAALLSLQLPVPKPQEQTEISGRFVAMKKSLDSLERELAKLRRLKTGLMQDLLTGKVSIQPLLETQTVS
jgi:type I restriction enzyme S subunit